MLIRRPGTTTVAPPEFVAASQNGGTATSTTVTLPTGWQSGHLLMMVCAGDGITFSMPAGWVRWAREQRAGTAGASTGEATVFVKFASGGETDPVVTKSGTSVDVCQLLAFSGVSSLYPVNAVTAQYGSAAGTANATPRLTTTDANCRIVRIVYQLATSAHTHTWPTSTEHTDGLTTQGSTRVSLTVASSTQTTAGDAPAETATSTVSATWAGITIALAPTNAAAPAPQRRPSPTGGALSSINTTSTTSRSFNYPQFSADGDLLIMQVFAWKSAAGAYSITTPTGWNKLDGVNSATGTADTKITGVYWRWRSTETSVTVATSVAAYVGVSIVAYNPESCHPTNPIVETRFRYDNDDVASRSTPVIETPVPRCALLFMAASLLGSTGTVTHTWKAPDVELTDVRSTVSTLSFNLSTAWSVEPWALWRRAAVVTPSNAATLGWMTGSIALQPKDQSAPRKWVLPDTGAASWTPPASMNVKAYCWGAGGGGAGSGTTSGYAGGGGGGGALSIKQFAVTSGVAVNYSIGAGMVIAAAGANNGTAGGDTWFSANSSAGCVAKGGAGGTAGAAGNSGNGPGGAGGAAASGFGDTKYSGGNGEAGVINSFSGAGGGAAGTTGDGNHGSIGGIAGAVRLLGGGEGGTGRTGSTQLSADWGSNPGGGGSGGRRVSTTSSPGGPGAHGRIEIYEVVGTTPSTPWSMFVSDGFDGTGALDTNNWFTTGGGTLDRLNGELNGDSTPSVPISYAWSKTLAGSGTQISRARIKWNDRTPQHSASGVVVRADPLRDTGNPGTQNGVMFVVTQTIIALYYEDFDQPNGYVPVTGTAQYENIPAQYPEGSLIEVRAEGNLYTALVNGAIVLQGTVDLSIIPTTNRYVGLTIQNDELEVGGDEPPGRLDDWEAWHKL